MGHFVHKKDSEGFITVFLSLILMIILSLVMTIIEGARINTAKLFAERAFTTAIDSVMAEFYAPLMEEYHILGLEASYGEGSVNEEKMKARVSEYMSYTFTPNLNITGSKEGVELYDISVDSLQLNGYTGLMDYQGELFINECVEYMKYKELGNGMELLLDKISLLEEPKKISILYEEKLKVEEELVAVDEGILNLMRILDGVSTDKKGIKVNKEGNLQTLSDFVKKFYYGTLTKEKVGINNESIFQALQNHYVDPSNIFLAAEEDFDDLISVNLRIQELEAQIAATSAKIEEAAGIMEELEQKLSGAKARKEDTKVLSAQIKEYENYRNGLEDSLDGMGQELTGCYQKKLVCTDEISFAMNNMKVLVQSIIPKIIEAVGAIDGIMETSAKADPLILEYERILEEQRQGLGSAIFESLEEGLKELKRYQKGNKAGYNFPLMKDSLEKNLSVLSSSQSMIAEALEAMGLEDYEKARESFGKVAECLLDYQTEGLTIDYSTLVIRKETDIDPLGTMNTLIGEGLTGLVVDSSTISQAELTNEMLPSDYAALVDQGEESGFDFLSFFGDLVIGGKSSRLGAMFGSFGDYEVSSMISDGINMAAEHLLYWFYLQEHFYTYPSEETDLSGRKPSALTYEQEYLLAGKPSDQDNLAFVISRIIFLRTILDFTSLLGDKAKWNEAKLLAASLVGFTGLPILVSITQTIIMLLLAFAEALVDTSALLMGKEVPILKKKVQLNVYELVGLNRTFIQTKASNYPKAGEGLSLSYPDYLKVFLFFKSKKNLSFRSMDLIQENIQLRYEDSFFIANCLYGIEAEAEFMIEPKFISLPIIQGCIRSNKGFGHKVLQAYSY